MAVGKRQIPAQGGRSRAILNSIAAKYAKQYAGASNITISQGFLRLESPSLAGSSQIGFAVTNNENAPGATSINITEKRLAITDNFLATEMGIYIYKYTSTAPEKAVLITFPNPLVYSGSGEADNLMNFYNGSLNLKVNGDTILDSWDVMRHYRVGNAQKSVLTAATGTGNSWGASTWDIASYGMFPVTPQIQLFGAGKNQFSINMPAADSLAGTSSTNVAVILLRGFLIQNGSSVVQR